MNTMYNNEENRGVSPVVGVILMIALAVILSGVVSNFGLRLVNFLEPPITAGVNIAEDVNQQATGNAVTATVTWTQSGTSDRLTIVAGGTRGNLTKIGESITISGLEGDDTVKVIGTKDNRQSVVQLYEIG